LVEHHLTELESNAYFATSHFPDASAVKNHQNSLHIVYM
jgi:hypothetical protein